MAMATVRAWGYPRELTAHEVNLGSWFSYGMDVIFWFAPIPVLPGVVALHVAVDPESQRRHGSHARRLFAGIEVLADLLNVQCLVAADCTDTGVVAGYLERLGWEQREIPELEDGDWYVRELS